MKDNVSIIKIILLSIISVQLFVPLNVSASSANTLAELRKELSNYKAKKSAAEASEKRTQSQINSSKSSISSAQAEITSNQNKIEDAKTKINNLEQEINASKDKIEALMQSYQTMSGDNAYLEYIFGAKSISDFIIRLSISSQIASYNDSLIEGYEKNIEENKQLQIDLANRKESLNAQIQSLEDKIDSLGDDLSGYIEEAQSAADDISSTQKLIDYYVSLGCKEDETFSSCVAVRGDSKFIRPLNKGTITSYYGYRTHPVTGKVNSFHTGVDIGGNKEGTNVYAAANGVVGKIISRASCGGNQVYVYHNINGTKYTTLYMHLYSINVKLGDSVTTNTIVGTVGGYKTATRYGGYDRCSTGAHLHFSIAKGWYGSTYITYSSFVSNLINPRNMVNFPNMGKYFYARY